MKNIGFKFTHVKKFIESLEKLQRGHQQQIIKKINSLEQIKDISLFYYIKRLAKPINLFTHKLKIGKYRIFFRVEGIIIEAQYVSSRENAYRK